MFVNWVRNLSLIITVLLLVTVSQAVLAEAVESTEPKTAKRIVLVIGEGNDFAGCEKLGSVAGQSEESDNEKPYPQRLIIARTNLQKAAADLGADTVHVLNSNTTRFEVPGVTKQIIFSGEAYACE